MKLVSFHFAIPQQYTLLLPQAFVFAIHKLFCAMFSFCDQ
jgi:hypothetical protein